MSDLTLEDLAGSATEEAADQAADQAMAESGESLLDMVEFLDDRGYLGPLVFGAGDMDAGDMDTVDVSGGDGGGDGTGVALTAENIAAFGDVITSQIGDVPLSTVVEYAEENPSEVDALIQQNL